MTVERKDCPHAELVFGSGDYYLFCYACGARWAHIDMSDNLSPQTANRGIGSQQSGTVRQRS